MSIFISVQGSYKSYTIALFQDSDLIDQLNMDNTTKASAGFVNLLKSICEGNKKSLKDIDFIAADQGPGAFTSLRVIIATLNGLAFDSHVKLVGVDGLDALARESLEEVIEKNISKNYIVSLLNAYNQEVYYGIYKINFADKTLDLCENKSYKKIDLFISDLEKNYKKEEIIFTGNGAELFKLDPRLDLSVCSAKTVGLIGLEQWQDKINIYSELKPLYLKTQTFAVKKSIL
jgi:tRNA threonylcarbamoyladenosine biosynthesis protein TsaB